MLSIYIPLISAAVSSVDVGFCLGICHVYCQNVANLSVQMSCSREDRSVEAFCSVSVGSKSALGPSAGSCYLDGVGSCAFDTLLDQCLIEVLSPGAGLTAFNAQPPLSKPLIIM